MLNYLWIDNILKQALLEDAPDGDISTDSIVGPQEQCTADIIAKEDGMIAGLSIFERVFFLLGKVSVTFYVNEGEMVKKGMLIGRVEGNTRNVLLGERTALNYLQKLSGVATLTHYYVKALEGTGVKLLDTRKTTPNMRMLEKYAVKVGGGHNHRTNLSDAVMLKDNHIAAAGGIKAAVAKAREYNSFVRKIEVETESIEMVREALEAKADIIMLDNMTNEEMRASVEIIGDKALIEASGNMTLERLQEVAATGVQYISSGSLTHSYKCLDISLKNLRPIL